MWVKLSARIPTFSSLIFIASLKPDWGWLTSLKDNHPKVPKDKIPVQRS